MTFDRRWLPAALAALLLIVAACGDDDAGSTPTDESTQAATAADTATSVPTETSTPDPTEGPVVLPRLDRELRARLAHRGGRRHRALDERR